MPKIPNVTTVRVTELYRDGSGQLLWGTVTFTPVADRLASPGNTILIPSPISVRVQNGLLNVDLVASDDSDVQPGDWAYNVTEDFNGQAKKTYQVVITSAMAPTVRLSSLAPLGTAIGPVPPAYVKTINGQTGEVSLDKTSVGLSNVDNTSDLSKPVSTEQQTALNGKVDKLPLVVDVRDFNAKGDDTTDDTAAINAAVAAAPAGATVVLRGKHKVSGAINLKSNMTMEGQHGSLRQITNNTTTLILNNVSDVVIQNVTVTGVGTDYVNSSLVYTSVGVGIYGTSSRIAVRGCAFLNMAGGGLNLGGTVSEVDIVNCRMVGPGDAILNNGVDQYGGGVVMNSNGLSKILVSGCTISEFAQGIVTGAGSDFRFVGNNIFNIFGQHGMYLGAIQGLAIVGNTIRDVSLQGIKIQIAVEGLEARRIAITGNIISNSGSHPILLTAASALTSRIREVSITGNSVSSSAVGDGITVLFTEGVILANNSIRTVGRGIRTGTSSNVSISNNRIKNCALQGIMVDTTSDVQVVGNRIIDPCSGNDPAAEYGLSLHGADTANALIDGNIVSDSLGNMRYGLYLVAGVDQATITVRNNEFTGATDYGVRLENTQAIGFWANNVFSGALGSVSGFPTTFTVRGTPTQAQGTAAPTSGAWERGSIVWNLTPVPSGVIGWICTASGTPGTWTTFGSTLSSSWTGPNANGLLAATFDPIQANITMPVMTAGVLYLARLDVFPGGQLSSVDLLVGGAGVGLTAGQNLVGIYSFAAGGGRLAASVDQSTVWNSTGQRTAVMTAPTPVLDAGSAIYVGLLWNGTTSPQLRGLATTAGFVNVRAALPRYATAGSGLTALPANLPALTAATTTTWMGAS